VGAGEIHHTPDLSRPTRRLLRKKISILPLFSGTGAIHIVNKNWPVRTARENTRSKPMTASLKQTIARVVAVGVLTGVTMYSLAFLTSVLF
jgi:hypothetical protein